MSHSVNTEEHNIWKLQTPLKDGAQLEEVLVSLRENELYN